ncbi:DUF986 family protein, partial [Serratia sp. CY74664]|uniref:DUF986 family protein n=1 Tax=Serratia sp. CY74664 TaxID=3383676 RepID=UPI003F9FED58
MSLTDAVLMLFITLLLLYSLYDEFGMDLLKGKTRLKVLLKRRHRLDSLIFVGLIAPDYLKKSAAEINPTAISPTEQVRPGL